MFSQCFASCRAMAASIWSALMPWCLAGWMIGYAIASRFTPAFIKHWADVMSSFAITVLRLGTGACYFEPRGQVERPKKPLKLYEFEGCPFCRKVREAISTLGLEVMVFPTPRVTLKRYGVVEGSRFRPVVMELGGQAQFPFLVDENTGVKMYESDNIVRYLFETYGGVPHAEVEKSLPFMLRKQEGRIAQIISKLQMMPIFLRVQAHNGLLKCPSSLPAKPLEFYGFESDPFSRIVREALTCLELPYLYRTAPYGSIQRRDRWFTTLRLHDPNTGFSTNCARTAAEYLYRTYQTGAWPNEIFWGDYSTAGASKTHGTVVGSAPNGTAHSKAA